MIATRFAMRARITLSLGKYAGFAITDQHCLCRSRTHRQPCGAASTVPGIPRHYRSNSFGLELSRANRSATPDVALFGEVDD